MKEERGNGSLVTSLVCWFHARPSPFDPVFLSTLRSFRPYVSPSSSRVPILDSDPFGLHLLPLDDESSATRDPISSHCLL